MSQLHWLDSDIWFPASDTALRDPDGLLAVGGDLTLSRLIHAYSRGIFPWYSEGQPLLWWTPDPRMVLMPGDLHLGRSVKKLLRKQPFTITIDSSFESVMRHCGTIERKNQDGSWITEEMIDAYMELHAKGIAHSVEARIDGELVGGLYGVALGRAYFGESMFSLVSGASKAAFATLARQLQLWQFELIDCQIHTKYLASFGATEMPRTEFERRLTSAAVKAPTVEFSEATPNQMMVYENGALQHPVIRWKDHWRMPESGFDGSVET